MSSGLPELGVCYYPEHWAEAQWPEDAGQMVDMGLSWVRIGEFAWSRIEPIPDKLNWDWLDRALDVLGAAGLKVVLGTPTATPPRWMIDKHPDMLAVDAEGNTRKFGSRRHYNFAHLGYRVECARIARLMGERYGKNPHIQAWQIDNEYGCHDTVLSYSSTDEAAFRIWLAKKYSDVEALNQAWGNVFWSMEYANFEQVQLPNLTVTEASPSHVMDYRRYASDQVVAFNKVQVDILKGLTDKPLIHNYMGRTTEFDHFEVGAVLDIASWDSYPLGFLEDRSDQGEDFKHQFRRQGDPDFQAFHHDLYRAVGRGKMWVMEQQPGPVNWAPYNPKPMAGMVRLWSWEAIAHGAEAVNYFRWRQAPFAQEQMHAGIQLPNGDWADGHDEIVKTAQEIVSLPAAKSKDADVAIVFDYSSAWAWEAQPQGKDFDYFRLGYEFYCGLRRLGLSIDIVSSTCTNFGDRKLVVIPGLFAWNKSIKTAIGKFGGQVVLGPRTGSKTPDFHIPDCLPPHIDGFDAQVTSVETLRPTAPIALEPGGHFQIWREHLKTSHEIVERGDDGAPAHIKNANLHYLAGWPDKDAMVRILSGICENSGIATENLPEGYRRREFGDFTLHMNYSESAIDFEGLTLKGADIALVHNKTKERLI